MKHLARITVFVGLIIAFALAASVQAAPLPETTQAEGTKSAGKQITRDTNKTTKNTMTRSATSHSSPVWIHDTWLDYVTDIDGDGFYHHFRFSFDADTSYLSQALVAEVYLSDGDDEWRIFTSNTFWINGSSGSDVYEMSTSLNDGYPTQAYDLTLRLYDAVNHELLEEWTYLDDSNLDSLFLEDSDSDTLFSSSPYIHNFELTLSDDFDNDGYFSNINFKVDVDSPNGVSDVRIGVEIYDGSWDSIYLSGEYTVSGSDNNDSQIINIDLDHGYPADQYQLKITVYESLSRAVLATETISQTAHLESLEYESDSHGDYDDHSRSSSSHGHGGSMGLLALPLMALMIVRKKFKK